MEYNTINGIDDNSKEPDLPVGFGMRLAMEPEAMQAYSTLSNMQKREVIHYMQEAVTGDDSEFRVMNSIEKLKNHQVSELLTGRSQQDRFF